MPERRFIVLGADGRHITLGRAGPPEDAEAAAIVSALHAAGVEAAWLVEMTGNYWGRGRVGLTALRPLMSRGDWPQALDAFEARRCFVKEWGVRVAAV
ncbi:hypothetical protein ACQW02_27785 [Humitalea sp. 24SJ18S-53]|uniref:hypothetical protein n=1 Tax=Humitalea sp. 24SJ18S-53 TaxID=3422307 RepID=UPI003D67D43F